MRERNAFITLNANYTANPFQVQWPHSLNPQRHECFTCQKSFRVLSQAQRRRFMRFPHSVHMSMEFTCRRPGRAQSGFHRPARLGFVCTVTLQGVCRTVPVFETQRGTTHNQSCRMQSLLPQWHASVVNPDRRRCPGLDVDS